MDEPSTREFEGLRVLVVEDDYHVATSLAQALTRLGCEVVGPTATGDRHHANKRIAPDKGALGLAGSANRLVIEINILETAEAVRSEYYLCRCFLWRRQR